MSHNCNLSGKSILEVSENTYIVTKHVEQIDAYSSKFKAMYLMYNCNHDRYDFIDEVFFFAPTPRHIRDSENCLEIKLKISIVKVYKTLMPGSLTPGRDDLMEIIIKEDCEYKRNQKSICESQYEIPFVIE